MRVWGSKLVMVCGKVVRVTGVHSTMPYEPRRKCVDAIQDLEISNTPNRQVVVNASGKDKDPGDPRHERRAAATAAFGDSDIEAIGGHGSAAAAHSSMRTMELTPVPLLYQI